MRLEEATILVVDDEAELREIFSGWLGRTGSRVLTASNGAEALQLLTAEKVDVLLSDIRMPIMGGVDLVRNIYQRKLFIPSIIFVSGFGDVEPREMHWLGVEALMEKPLNRKDLLRMLSESLTERDQLWHAPAAGPMAQSLSIEIASLEDALETCEFQLGRGGCCFATGSALVEDKTIDLAIRFTREGLCLKVQGKVKWYAKDDGRAGISFNYLHPESREWVLRAMREGAYRSFIPQCRACP